MQRSEAVDLCARRLGYRTNKNDEIAVEMQLAQQRLEQGVIVANEEQQVFTFHPYFLLSELESKLTTIGEERIPVPDAFLKEAEPDALWRYNAAATEATEVWTVLCKDDLDHLRKRYSGSGQPAAYALTGRYFRLLPTPDKEYVIRMLYYKADTVLNAPSVENKWLNYAHLLLCAETVKNMAPSLRDTFPMQWAQATYKEEALRLWMQSEDRTHTNRRYVMGGAD